MKTDTDLEDIKSNEKETESFPTSSEPEQDLVTYEITPYPNPTNSNSDQYKVLFTLPTNLYIDIDETIAKPIAARGCYFTLRKGSRKIPNEMGKIICIFESALPQETAKSIALKISARIRNPTPDGVGDACNIA